MIMQYISVSRVDATIQPSVTAIRKSTHIPIQALCSAGGQETLPASLSTLTEQRRLQNKSLLRDLGFSSNTLSVFKSNHINVTCRKRQYSRTTDSHDSLQMASDYGQSSRKLFLTTGYLLDETNWDQW